jgi:hypothetical protein
MLSSNSDWTLSRRTGDMPGLDPGIHQSSRDIFFKVDGIAGSSPAMTEGT